MIDDYADIVVADSPDAYWKFQDVDNAVMKATVGADGTYYGGPLCRQEPLRISGLSTRFRYSNASPSYARVAGVGNYTASDFTIEFWIRPYLNMTGTFNNQYPCVLFKGAYQTAGWYLQFIESAVTGHPYLTFRTNQIGASQLTESAVDCCPEGKRTHVVIDRQGASVRMFFNNVETAYRSQGSHVDPASSADDLWVASYMGAASMYAQMGISDLAIYPRRLTDAERLEHYAAGAIAAVAPPSPRIFESWTKSPSNPVLAPTQPWEGDCVFDGCVCKDGSVYYNFYCAVNVTVDIGYATTDAAHYPVAWTKYPGNPVLLHDAVELGPASPKVFKLPDNSRIMYYQSSLSSGKVEPRYALATAAGFPNVWAKGNVSILSCGADGEWDSVQIQAHGYVPPWESPDGLWHMFYGGYDGYNWRGGHATSRNGIIYTKDPLNPIFFPHGAAWKSRCIIPFSAMKHNDCWYIVLAGSNDDVWQTGYAFTTKGNFSAWEVTDTIIVPSGAVGWESSGDIEGGTLYHEPGRATMEIFYLSSNVPNPTLGGSHYRQGVVSALISSDTLRQRILDALKARLQTILIANGYKTNLGQHVYEWDLAPLDPNLETFALEYRDANEEITDETVGEQIHKLQVELRIRTASAIPLSDMRKMIGDVITAMGADATFGGLCDDIVQQGVWALDKGQAADTVAGAAVMYVIDFNTDRWNPYA